MLYGISTAMRIYKQLRHKTMPGSISIVLSAGIILDMGSPNEKRSYIVLQRRYTVTPSLIGWAHTQDDPCYCDDMGNTLPWQFPIEIMS